MSEAVLPVAVPELSRQHVHRGTVRNVVGATHRTPVRERPGGPLSAEPKATCVDALG